MKARLYRKLMTLSASASLGTLWLFGCVTDLEARDFLVSTVVRTFFQTLASAFQAAVVDAVQN